MWCCPKMESKKSAFNPASFPHIPSILFAIFVRKYSFFFDTRNEYPPIPIYFFFVPRNKTYPFPPSFFSLFVFF